MAEAVFVRNCGSVRYTAGGAITRGDVIDLGDRFGIAADDMVSGDLGTVDTEGIFKFTKPNDQAMVRSTRVFWDDGNAQATLINNGGANRLLGVVTEDAAETATEVVVEINELDKSNLQLITVSIADLAAGADVADQVGYELPIGSTLVFAGFIPDGAVAGIDGSNTLVVTVKQASGTIFTKTFGATAPTANRYNSLGAVDPDYADVAASTPVKIDFTQGATANMPATRVFLGILPKL